jgi:hypothetical protein
MFSNPNGILPLMFFVLFFFLRISQSYTGNILVSVNPYKMFDIYGLDMVKKYENQILGTLPPWVLFLIFFFFFLLLLLSLGFEGGGRGLAELVSVAGVLLRLNE